MTPINEFQIELQAIDPTFTIVPNENNEMASVLWNGYDAGIAMAKDGVKEERDLNYCDYFDRPHKTRPQVLEQVSQFLENIKRPEAMEILTDTDA